MTDVQIGPKGIIWPASAVLFKRDILNRYGRVKGALAVLKNQDSLYFQEHRRLAALYEAVLQVIDEHERSALGEKDQPR